METHQFPKPAAAAEMDEYREPAPAAERHRGGTVPLLLFLATCVTTSRAYGVEYAAAVMTILLCHEFGHFLQAQRYGVPASFPYFIPIPARPIGTMGAVIFMQPGKGDRRAIFDIAITGPLAGLVPTLVFSVIGLYMSQVVLVDETRLDFLIGKPLLFKGLIYLFFGTLAPGEHIALHPIAFAGWVGIFVTALNLIPIGQLDGGHILYALLRGYARIVARLLLFAAAAGVVLFGYWGWSIMLLLLMIMGPDHPPTANDNVPLGSFRTILGWATLLFIIVGFTPEPFSMHGTQ